MDYEFKIVRWNEPNQPEEGYNTTYYTDYNSAYQGLIAQFIKDLASCNADTIRDLSFYEAGYKISDDKSYYYVEIACTDEGDN